MCVQTYRWLKGKKDGNTSGDLKKQHVTQKLEYEATYKHFTQAYNKRQVKLDEKLPIDISLSKNTAHYRRLAATTSATTIEELHLNDDEEF